VITVIALLIGAVLGPNAHVFDGVKLTSGVVPSPTQQAVQIDPRYSCVVCHNVMRRAFLLGVHSERGIRCHDCHGGNPTAFEVGPAHSGADFMGTPDKLGTVALCSSCHSDPDQMRQYGLAADQLAEFRTSRHGQLLLVERDNNAPTCTDCHDAHTILPANDARSNVYPTNTVKTCAHCHEDLALMSQYDLRTDQVARYRESTHGVEVFQNENFAAPTCVDCHGSHAALPPQVAEVANVCGHCHVLVRRAFYSGPHGDAARAGALPGCTACHSNHGTERVAPQNIASTCTDCHAEGSPAALMGDEIQHGVLRATSEIHSAEEAIRNLVRAGRKVTDVGFRYESALTIYSQLGQVQHRLDLAALEDLERQVASISRDVRASEEVAAEHIWEHKLLLIPVWFLALSGVVLAWFKLRALSSEER
jgi:hypothetical protein